MYVIYSFYFQQQQQHFTQQSAGRLPVFLQGMAKADKHKIQTLRTLRVQTAADCDWVQIM